MEQSFVNDFIIYCHAKHYRGYQSDGRKAAKLGLITALKANSWDMKRAQILVVKILL